MTAVSIALPPGDGIARLNRQKPASRAEDKPGMASIWFSRALETHGGSEQRIYDQISAS
jgi:hypothetical protein